MKMPYPIYSARNVRRRHSSDITARNVFYAIAIPAGCFAAAWVLTSALMHIQQMKP